MKPWAILSLSALAASACGPSLGDEPATDVGLTSDALSDSSPDASVRDSEGLPGCEATTFCDDHVGCAQGYVCILEACGPPTGHCWPASPPGTGWCARPGRSCEGGDAAADGDAADGLLVDGDAASDSGSASDSDAARDADGAP